jgi:hypothetical protein
VCRAQNSAALQQSTRFLKAWFSVRLSTSAIAMEVPRVDVTMKLNVLAVCAAFVFVGAIVLGAF